MEKRHLPDVIVKESPKNRYFNRLLETYESKWVVDLHDPARGYNPTNASDRLLAILVSSEHLDNRLIKFVNLNKYPVGVVGSNREHPRRVAVELSPWYSKKISIDFLGELLQFLKSQNLDPTL